jgi:hypothetical protein
MYSFPGRSECCSSRDPDRWRCEKCDFIGHEPLKTIHSFNHSIPIDAAKQIASTLDRDVVPRRLDQGIHAAFPEDVSPFALAQHSSHHMIPPDQLQKAHSTPPPGKFSDVDSLRFGKGRDQDDSARSSSAIKAFDPFHLDKMRVVTTTSHVEPGNEGRMFIQLEKMRRLGTLDSFNQKKGEYVEKHFSGKSLSEFLSPRPRFHSDSDASASVSASAADSSVSSVSADLLKTQASVREAFSEELERIHSQGLLLKDGVPKIGKPFKSLDDTLVKFAIGESDKGDMTVRLRDASETLIIPKTNMLKSTDESLRSLEVEYAGKVRPKEWEEMKTFAAGARTEIFGPISDLEQNKLRLQKIFDITAPGQMRRAGFTSQEAKAIDVWSKNRLGPYLERLLHSPQENQALLRSLERVLNRLMKRVMMSLLEDHPDKTNDIARVLVSQEEGLMKRLMPLLKDFPDEKEMMEVAIGTQEKLVAFMKTMSEAAKRIYDFRQRFIQVSSRVSDDVEVTLDVQKWFDDSLFGSWRSHYQTKAMKTEQKIWFDSAIESAFRVAQINLLL